MKDTVKELIRNKQYSEFKKMVEYLEEADIADILGELHDEELVQFFRLLPKTIAADTFAFLDVESKKTIITSLATKEAAMIIDDMYADDAADLMEEMPANVIQKILYNTTPETRRDINFLLNYPEDSAGSIMTVEFMDIKNFMTVEDAIKKIKEEAVDKETVDFCYVLDKHRKLLGTVSLKQLLLADNEKMISEIMEENPITVTTHTDQEQVAKEFQKYDVTTMPVVDSENRLVGIITIDDIMDIMQVETTEDIEKMAAIVPTDRPYLKLKLWEIYKSRMPWLLFLMISATFTGKIISSYEGALASYTILTMFIPMIMDTGGNAGGQASVTIIRALSLGEVKFKDTLRVFLKEFSIGIICGLTLAVCNFFKLLWIDHISISFAGIVCLALLVTVILAKIIGAILPILASKIHLDPAVMANPIITTIVDALSLMVYFQIASMILGL